MDPVATNGGRNSRWDSVRGILSAPATTEASGWGFSIWQKTEFSVRGSTVQPMETHKSADGGWESLERSGGRGTTAVTANGWKSPIRAAAATGWESPAGGTP